MLFIAIPYGLSYFDEELTGAYVFLLVSLWIAGVGFLLLTSGLQMGWPGRRETSLFGVFPLLIGLIGAAIGVINFLHTLTYLQ